MTPQQRLKRRLIALGGEAPQQLGVRDLTGLLRHGDAAKQLEDGICSTRHGGSPKPTCFLSIVLREPTGAYFFFVCYTCNTPVLNGLPASWRRTMASPCRRVARVNSGWRIASIQRRAAA